MPTSKSAMLMTNTPFCSINDLGGESAQEHELSTLNQILTLLAHYTHLGTNNSFLIQSYCFLAPHTLRPLIHAVKRWAKARKINDPSVI